jgi:hypothetical protein
MNNTELTLDQLAEIAGGPHYRDWFSSSFMSRAIIHPNFKTGLHDSVHCFRGKQARKLETRVGGSSDPGGDDI